VSFKLKNKKEKKTFMDFCAGIGGGRLGLTNNGLSCVAYSEIDTDAIQSYQIFHGDNENNFGDLMQIIPEKLPDFDILIGGFPCQTFSIVGKREGFNDNRGLIIYGICKILKEKDIPYFILENVKGLVNHDRGVTLQTIVKELNKLNYSVKYTILNSSDYGVPQMRERVYIVGMKNGFYNKSFKFPKPKPMSKLGNYLIDDSDLYFDINNKIFQKYLNNKYNKNKYNIDEILENDYLILDTRQSDLRLYKGKCPTLRTGRHGILYVKNKKLKKLSGFEALLLQGFPAEIAQKAIEAKILNNKLLSQAGNAMTVNVVEAIGNELLECCI
jgi:DNA (cytosine-5)-methyltransferase 1